MATEADIQNWFRQNPNATDEQIYAVMKENSVTPEDVQQAMGGNLAGYQQRYNDQEDPSLSSEIRKWFKYNPDSTDEQIYAVMQANKVTPEDIYKAMGGNLAGYQARYNEMQAKNTPIGLVGFEQETKKGLSDATNQLNSTLAKINSLYGINISDLQNAASVARGDITKGYGEARGYFDPFYQGGQTAYQKQLALSGALGQDAFNAARQESPYEKFLFEQGMRANLAGASATGGLGGGNVQKELQRFGQGLSSQGLQQQIGNLGALSGMGFQSAGALGNIATGEGAALADIGLNTAQNIVGQRGQQAGYEANVGTNIAQMQQNTAQNIASNRMSVAEMIARQQENAALQQANLLESQGINMSNLIGTQGQNVINLGQGAYDQYIQDLMNQGMTQAEILGGQGFAQAPPTDYRGMTTNALNAAGTGYYLGQRMQTPTQNPQAPYFSGRNPSPSYGQQGRWSTGIPGMPSFNYLSGAGLKRLSGGNQ